MVINKIQQLFSKETEEVRWLNTLLMGHAAFQILNAGCELKVFAVLNQHPGLTREELNSHLNLKERPLNCILLGLCSLRLVIKKGDAYYNCDTIKLLFENDFWDIFYDIVVFENKIVYLGQFDFVESLKTDSNVGLRRIAGNGSSLYHRLSENEGLQEAFYSYMSSWSKISIPLLINSGVLLGKQRILDVGGGDATNAIAIANAYPESYVDVFELPENSSVAFKKISNNRLENRISIIEGDMFKDDFRKNYDCISFIHQFVIWSREQTIFLLKKAYQSLLPNGSVVIFNSITSDDGQGPLFGALDSVYFMSIPISGGMIYPWHFYEECLLESGFDVVEKRELNTWSPHGVVIGYKK